VKAAAPAVARPPAYGAAGRVPYRGGRPTGRDLRSPHQWGLVDSEIRVTPAPAMGMMSTIRRQLVKDALDREVGEHGASEIGSQTPKSARAVSARWVEFPCPEDQAAPLDLSGDWCTYG